MTQEEPVGSVPFLETLLGGWLKEKPKGNQSSLSVSGMVNHLMTRDVVKRDLTTATGFLLNKASIQEKTHP